MVTNQNNTAHGKGNMKIKTLSTLHKKVYQLDCTTPEEVMKMKEIKKRIREYNSLFDMKITAKWLDTRKLLGSKEIKAIWVLASNSCTEFEAASAIFEDIVSDV